MKTLNDVMNELPAEDRAQVMARFRELKGQEMALQHVRRALHLTQKRMAELLGIGQDSVSRLERRSDLLISTLQSYVEAMGGSLKLVAQFRDGTVVLTGLGEAADEEEPATRKRASAHRPHLAAARTSKRKHLEHRY
jgi:transcriptional regulator with XRE-family HTH domain